MNETKQRYHPLTFVAFLLAVFVLIAPTQVDVVWSALHKRQVWQAFISVIFSLLVVVLPLAIGQVQTKRDPMRWKPRFLTKLTWFIVGLNIAFNIMTFVDFWSHNNYEESQTIRKSNDR